MIRSSLWIALLASLFGLFGSGCRDPEYATCEEPPIPAPADETPTWHGTVRPIYEASCVRCHYDGGPAGFDLSSYALAADWAVPASLAVANKTMPPWPAADCCQSYANDFGLGPADVAAIQAWADGDAPEGDPTDYVAPVIPDTALPRVDLSLTMDAPYLPELVPGETDLSRCFLLDWPEEQTRFVTGLGVRPGNAEVVHHAIALIAGPEVVSGFETLDAADAGPGWDCPGGVVWGATGWLGGWSPGWEGQENPGGRGHEVLPGSKIILSIHYSVVSSEPSPDQTTLDLMLADEVPGTLESLSVYDPAWLSGDLRIPANEEDVVHSFVSTPAPREDGGSRDLVAVNLHMHERGSHGQVAILHPNGSTTCLLQVDRWSYDWQTDYILEQTIALDPDDRLLVECHFDNTGRNQRTVNGTVETPRDLNWAEDEEMCVAYVTAGN
ncbi:MAG: monooxygenase [Deltaproteobacteria bacterium]|nr:monooxygenase [Deltaproteobacteria bacterium]